MTFTTQQLDIINAIGDASNPIVLVRAKSGASKSTTVIEGLNRYQFKDGLALAYNNKIAKENKQKMPSYIENYTFHALAYKYVIRKGVKYSLKPYFSYDFYNKYGIQHIKLFNQVFKTFCLSSDTSVTNSSVLSLYPKQQKTIKKIFDDFLNNELFEITHDFYLKIFHLLLVNNIIDIKYDVIFADECGDLNGCFLDIFIRLKANKKIAVFDEHQNLYKFNHTIKGGDILVDYYKTKPYPLSKTFRSSITITDAVKRFMDDMIKKYNYHNDSYEFNFDGVEMTQKQIEEPPTNIGYLTMTNVELLDMMCDLYSRKIHFSLTRKFKDIFSSFYYIISLERKAKQFMTNNSYSDDIIIKLYAEYLQYKKDDDKFYDFITDTNNIYAIDKYKVLYSQYKQIDDICNAYKIDLFDIEKFAKKINNNIILSTIFSAKGLTIDRVLLSDKCDTDIKQTLEKYSKNKIDYNEFETAVMLYYVGTTRARTKLKANFLKNNYNFNSNYSYIEFITDAKQLNGEAQND